MRLRRRRTRRGGRPPPPLLHFGGNFTAKLVDRHDAAVAAVARVPRIQVVCQGQGQEQRQWHNPKQTKAPPCCKYIEDGAWLSVGGQRPSNRREGAVRATTRSLWYEGQASVSLPRCVSSVGGQTERYRRRQSLRPRSEQWNGVYWES